MVLRILLLLLLVVPLEARGRRKTVEAIEVEAHVYAVSDGDTILARRLSGGNEFRVRLVGIDAPEKKQPFGQASKRHLSELIFDKDVRIVIRGRDRYRRALGDIYVGEDKLWVNREMVRSGFAWQFLRYDKTEVLREAEQEAREARRGLWRDLGTAAPPIAPWAWRHGRRPPKSGQSCPLLLPNTSTRLMPTRLNRSSWLGSISQTRPASGSQRF